MVSLLGFGDADQSVSCTTNSTWSLNGLIVAGGNNNSVYRNFRPFDFAFDSQHNVYVADPDETQILMYPYNYTIGQVPTVVLSNVSCQALYIDNYDNLYFGDSGSVKILNRTTGNITVFTKSYYSIIFQQYQPLVSPSNLYIDSKSRLYVSDRGMRVIRYLLDQPNNSTVLTDASSGPGISQCIFIDETDNNAFYTCIWPSTIVKFTNDGANWTTIADGKTLASNTSANVSLSFDSVIVDSLAQQLYISDGINHRIIRWSLSNSSQQGQVIIQLPNTTSQRRIRLDKDKNLYVGAIDDVTGGQVLKYINCNPNQTITITTSTTTATTYTSMTTTTSIANSTSNVAAMNSVAWNFATLYIFVSITMIIHFL
ncbi:unnamed protein product [Adineta ricciae]|uniref:NHL repeat containing protein-like protein n=1 Tax=Adineta ricciae TaxID=249248 RepID=A0A815FTD6_ADIRI|nr:unnamed protein product [Adineta ricciae]